MPCELLELDMPHADTAQRCFRLEGDLCIFHAAEVKPVLLDVLSPSAECQIDLAGVSEVDTAGVQLLLLAKREAGRSGCKLIFVNHSDSLLEVIDLLNLSRDFGDPVLITADRAEARHGS